MKKEWSGSGGVERAQWGCERKEAAAALATVRTAERSRCHGKRFSSAAPWDVSSNAAAAPALRGPQSSTHCVTWAVFGQRVQRGKLERTGFRLGVHFQGQVMTSDSFATTNVETGAGSDPGSDPGCPLECMCSAVRQPRFLLSVTRSVALSRMHQSA